MFRKGHTKNVNLHRAWKPVQHFLLLLSKKTKTKLSCFCYANVSRKFCLVCSQLQLLDLSMHRFGSIRNIGKWGSCKDLWGDISFPPVFLLSLSWSPAVLPSCFLLSLPSTSQPNIICPFNFPSFPLPGSQENSCPVVQCSLSPIFHSPYYFLWERGKWGILSHKSLQTSFLLFHNEQSHGYLIQFLPKRSLKFYDNVTRHKNCKEVIFSCSWVAAVEYKLWLPETQIKRKLTKRIISEETIKKGMYGIS